MHEIPVVENRRFGRVELNIDREQDFLEIVIPAKNLDCCLLLARLSFTMFWSFCMFLGPVIPLMMSNGSGLNELGIIVAFITLILMWSSGYFTLTKGMWCDTFVDILSVTGHHNRRQFSVDYKLFNFTILRGRKCIPNDFLTQEEIKWLDYELKDWLNSWYNCHLPVCTSVTSLPR